MVEVIKHNARKPMIADGGFWQSEEVKWREDPARPGFNQADGMRYVLHVHSPAPDKTEIILRFTEDEMIEVATEWLKRYATGRRHRREEEKARARKEQSRHPGVSPQAVE